MWRYWLDSAFNDLGTFLAKGRRFQSQILNNFFFFFFRFFFNTQVLCGLWQEINTFNSKIVRCYLVLLIRFLMLNSQSNSYK